MSDRTLNGACNPARRHLRLALVAATLLATGTLAAGPAPAAAASESLDCTNLRAQLADAKDRRTAYNGHEGNWAVKDEIAVIDTEIDGLVTDMRKAKCHGADAL